MSTTNKLAQVIRKIVKEEVRKEVRQILNENKKPKVTKKEFNTGLQHALGLADSVERAARKPAVKQQFTKNKMLNDILNETAGDIASGHTSRLSQEGGYPTMGNQTFTTENAETFDRNSLAAKLGYGDMQTSGTPSVQEMLPQRNTSGGIANNAQVDPAVAKALTRDYSELVKRFKK